MQRGKVKIVLTRVHRKLHVVAQLKHLGRGLSLRVTASLFQRQVHEFVVFDLSGAEKTAQRCTFLFISRLYRFQVFVECLFRINEKPSQILICLIKFIVMLFLSAAIIYHIRRVVRCSIVRLKKKLESLWTFKPTQLESIDWFKFRTFLNVFNHQLRDIIHL